VRNSSLIGRVAAVAALAVALVAVVLILFSGGSSYQVHAVFVNASQIVQGDLVEVSGDNVGTVSKIGLTPQGQAVLTLSINNSAYIKLPQGTQATIREASLSGIANRYVDLHLGPNNATRIPDNGVITSTNTTSEVDLDQIFNTLNGPTRKGLQDVFIGSASQYKDAGAVAQKAFPYLNPAIAASSTLFNEIDRDTGKFTNFVVNTGNLVTTLAQRSADLSGLIQHLSTTTGALAAEKVPLGESLQDLPHFMALANTTFVNLRSALQQLTPLVNVSKPAAPKLQKLLVQLRPLAVDSVPTVRDLALIISRPGANNDLIDLTRLGVPLANATVRSIFANGKKRPGAFPESITSLNGSTPELATARPYAVDLTGWFEGFTHPGGQDANGAFSRVAPVVGVGSVSNGALNILGSSASNPTGLLGTATGRSTLAFGTNGNNGILTTGQGDRCPGSMERGAVWYPETGYPCNPNEVPTGP
jgi:phospholipid/cholesterol/gamma-HCH transport system substrate-binding protein